MSKKTRFVKTTIFVRHEQLNELENANLQELEWTLKELCSKRGDGINCGSLINVIPVLASSNSVEINFVAFNEDIDITDDEDVINEIISIIDNALDIEISHWIIKQVTEPLVIFGDLS